MILKLTQQNDFFIYCLPALPTDTSSEWKSSGPAPSAARRWLPISTEGVAGINEWRIPGLAGLELIRFGGEEGPGHPPAHRGRAACPAPHCPMGFASSRVVRPLLTPTTQPLPRAATPAGHRHLRTGAPTGGRPRPGGAKRRDPESPPVASALASPTARVRSEPVAGPGLLGQAARPSRGSPKRPRPLGTARRDLPASRQPAQAHLVSTARLQHRWSCKTSTSPLTRGPHAGAPAAA